MSKWNVDIWLHFPHVHTNVSFCPFGLILNVLLHHWFVYQSRNVHCVICKFNQPRICLQFLSQRYRMCHWYEVVWFISTKWIQNLSISMMSSIEPYISVSCYQIRRKQVKVLTWRKDTLNLSLSRFDLTSVQCAKIPTGSGIFITSGNDWHPSISHMMHHTIYVNLVSQEPGNDCSLWLLRYQLLVYFPNLILFSENLSKNFIQPNVGSQWRVQNHNIWFEVHFSTFSSLNTALF